MADTANARVEERELLKTMRWWDGFVIALANPGFLIASLGFSVGVLGAWGAVLVWTASMVIGTLQAWIYQEPAAMFPDKSGGISLYAHEGWKRYFSPMGPIATFGYWFGWSSVLAIFGLTIGDLIKAEWFEGSTWDVTIGDRTILNLPKLIAISAIVVIWIFNRSGMRPAVWVSYLTGALLCIPLAVVMIGSFLTGDFDGDLVKWESVPDGAGGFAGPSFTVILVWLYLMGWSSYATEACATFAPEYHDTVNDTAKALKSSSLFDIVVFFLLPLGVVGTLSYDEIGAGASGGYLVETMREIVGGGATGLFLIFVVAGLLLSMNTATMDGSRALYGISRDGMTIKWLGKLNERHVPGNAMALDSVLNIVLIMFFDNKLSILAASNLGYVFAHFAALTGFLLLRKDRPEASRPIKVASSWEPIAAVLALLNGLFIVVGFANFELTGYASGDEWIGISRELWLGVLILLVGVGLWVYRHVVEDKQPLKLRETV